LGGVSCTSAAWCIAVGHEGQQSQDPLVERWNGRRWSIQPTPNVGGKGGSLSGVSCTSPSACIVVGSSYLQPGPLVERWNGRTWSIQQTPHLKFGGGLGSVSCTSPSACTAVGGSNGEALVERWNGRQWSIQSTPSPNGVGGLASVWCTSPRRCTAVGSYGQPPCSYTGCGSLPFWTLAERWNGDTWSIQPTPLSIQFATLNGVSCASARACTAVGAQNYTEALAERWNGRH
jgi:hypothetical protein